MQKDKSGDEVRIQRRMRVAPQRQVLAFENGRQIHGKQRIVRNVQRHVEVLHIVQMKSLADEWRVKEDGEGNEYCKITRCSGARTTVLLHPTPDR